MGSTNMFYSLKVKSDTGEIFEAEEIKLAEEEGELPEGYGLAAKHLNGVLFYCPMLRIDNVSQIPGDCTHVVWVNN